MTPFLLAAGMTISALAGGQVNVGTDQQEKVTPFASVMVDAPTADADMAPRLLVEATFTALPGGNLSLAQVETVKAIEFRVGIAQPIHRSLNFRLYAAGGFASRLPGDSVPSERAPKFGSVGLVFGSLKSGAWLAVGGGGDQRLSRNGVWRAALHVDGSVRLYQPARGSSLERLQLRLVGSAILGLEGKVGAGGRYDVIRLAVSVGI